MEAKWTCSVEPKQPWQSFFFETDSFVDDVVADDDDDDDDDDSMPRWLDDNDDVRSKYWQHHRAEDVTMVDLQKNDQYPGKRPQTVCS